MLIGRGRKAAAVSSTPSLCKRPLQPPANHLPRPKCRPTSGLCFVEAHVSLLGSSLHRRDLGGSLCLILYV